MRRFAFLSAALGGLALAATAAATMVPRALSGIAPGVWEISRSAAGGGARPICVPRVVLLGQIAHGSQMCTRTVLRDSPGELVMDISCGPSDFGRSRITVTTPRSLKIETQGIHHGEPFDMTVYARRVGNCAPALERR
ncbi:DUF3617 domain-containing protein [Sphingomonas astaxanthinifaciens]|uniref:DUF3617 family protein n=1 Tax=Sphingomonas astaxanthinifaciens DSM 22298 TaxID=1123267 RepID=A0ABQ5Z752_9SPHN|nr:DUF3617 family protein [Sphingomonas astaxanthinifaciens]GLR47352.1 hypothetical protein GCM10007925_10630 [Sphingomonas astaxanthinifaciens DSM 22298]